MTKESRSSRPGADHVWPRSKIKSFYYLPSNFSLAPCNIALYFTMNIPLLLTITGYLVTVEHVAVLAPTYELIITGLSTVLFTSGIEISRR